MISLLSPLSRGGGLTSKSDPEAAERVCDAFDPEMVLGKAEGKEWTTKARTPGKHAQITPISTSIVLQYPMAT
jgi:hypothetical protein